MLEPYDKQDYVKIIDDTIRKIGALQSDCLQRVDMDIEIDDAHSAAHYMQTNERAIAVVSDLKWLKRCIENVDPSDGSDDDGQPMNLRAVG